MKLSNTSEYAIRILSFMAKEPNALYSAKSLIEILHISDKYLRKLMTDLSKAGFIKSVQGRDGGYSFNKSIKDIYLSDIIDVAEGMEKYKRCVLGFDKCSDENPCVMHNNWVDVRAKFITAVEQITLADLNFKNINKF